MSAGRQSKDVLLSALTERSPDLGGHLASVAELAERTARRLGLPAEEVERIRHAGELHDVGKVAIPDAILAKPGPLDEDEWGFVRRHPLIGERIVRSAPVAEPRRRARALDPRALRRHRLPRPPAGRRDPARLPHRRRLRRLRRDDRASALRARRGRRRMRSTELRRCAGTQFDPAVVETFRAVVVEPTVPSRRRSYRTRTVTRREWPSSNG